MAVLLSFLGFAIPILGIHNPNMPKNCAKEIFYCEKHWSEMERFYREEGEWSKVFTMRVVRSTLQGGSICHVLYHYTPAPNSFRTDDGTDYRTFSFQQNPKTCKWKVVLMGDYHSGYLVKDD